MSRRSNAPSPATDDTRFAARLLRWFEVHGRHDLPWQSPRSAYRVWLSEVMLQQTQVATVVPYFQRFVERFPDFTSLAAASTDEVLALWSGLGYYARGRNLHRAAQRVVADHGGEMPRDFESVLALPGVGRSTAAAILSQAYGLRFAILDGNVKRVLARHAAIEGWPGTPAVAARLWKEAEARLPDLRLADYTQALMDLGATVCTARTPACARCPVSADCRAFIDSRVEALPSPRPRRQRPQRRAQLLLIENPEDDTLLLERRPPAGLWGGLWCAPVIDEDVDAVQWVQEQLGLETRVEGALPVLHHAFTHFDYALQPRRLRPRSASNRIADRDDRRWTTIAAAAALGLPAPLRRLLAQLEDAARPCPEPSTA